MALPQELADLPPALHAELIKEARKILEQIELNAFFIAPETVAPFGQAVVGWDVSGPAGEFTLTLNSDDVPLIGTRAVQPLATMTFRLQAQAYVLTRTLGQLTVMLDESLSEVFRFQQSAATDLMRDELQILLESNDTLKLRGKGGNATIDTVDGLTFHTELEVKVQDWFNADFDLDLRYMVFLDYTSAERNVRVLQREPSIDVRFHPLEHIASLGCSAAIQSAFEKVLRPLLKETVGNQVRAIIRRHLEEATDRFAELLTAVDGGTRTWRRFLSRTLDGEIEIRFSPMPVVVDPPLGPAGAVVVAPLGVPLG
jgi:uncharacterized metal-binding protein YceD (DUF177 family)